MTIRNLLINQIELPITWTSSRTLTGDELCSIPTRTCFAVCFTHLVLVSPNGTNLTQTLKIICSTWAFHCKKFYKHVKSLSTISHVVYILNENLLFNISTIRKIHVHVYLYAGVLFRQKKYNLCTYIYVMLFGKIKC